MSAIDSLTISPLRKAVVGAMRGLLSEKQIARALMLWDEAYASAGPEAILQFLEEAAAELDLPAYDQLELRVSMLKTAAAA